MIHRLHFQFIQVHFVNAHAKRSSSSAVEKRRQITSCETLQLSDSQLNNKSEVDAMKTAMNQI